MEGKAIATSSIAEGTVDKMQKHTISWGLLADWLTLVLGMNLVCAKKVLCLCVISPAHILIPRQATSQ